MTRQCGTPWGVCLYCLGQGLERTADVCRCPKCGLGYPERSFDSPCVYPVAVLMKDEDGTAAPVCASHAAHPSAAKLKKRPLSKVLAGTGDPHPHFPSEDRQADPRHPSGPVTTDPQVLQ